MIERQGAAAGITIREPRGHGELQALEDLQLEVWGFDDRELVPASHLRAVQHAGGLLLAAYAGGRLAGFVYGFAALAHDAWEHGVGVHSHLAAVRPGLRGAGVGRRLKWAQRTWCLERGLGWMTWTFDPMQAPNARLNFHHLGVVSHEYLVDFYGPMPGDLGGDQPSDRLVAFWDLRSPAVARRARRFALGRAAETLPPAPAAWLLSPGPGGEPQLREPADEAALLRVAVPQDATRLLREEPEAAARWRLAIRAALAPAVARGFVITAFAEGSYLLQRRDPPTPTDSQS